MKYNEIEIRLDPEGNWYISCYADKQNRIRRKTRPDAALGFYHAQADIPVEVAIEELRAAMIELREQEVKKLQDSIEALRDLTIPGHIRGSESFKHEEQKRGRTSKVAGRE